MMLIPRFYYIVDKSNHTFNVDKRRKNKKRYFVDASQDAQRFFVYYDNSYDGKFINIDDNYYYRPDWDVSKDWVFNNICMRYNVSHEDGHVMFKRPTRDLKNRYPYHQDLYQLFTSFSNFEKWLNDDDTKLMWKVLPYKKYDISAFRNMFISYIRHHFEETTGNIFLLKIKFNKNDITL